MSDLRPQLPADGVAPRRSSGRLEPESRGGEGPPAPEHVNGWRRAAWRWTRRVLLVAAAIVAALVVAFFSVDLGPGARGFAERYGSRYLERPLHIGSLRARAWPGRFELSDVVIEGVSKTDRPFFAAKKIVANVTWRTLFDRRLFVDVELADWTMLVEAWPGRPTNLPKLTPRTPRTEPAPFTTTVRVSAHGGRFSYVDHGAPWSVVAPNLNFDLVRAENIKSYVGTAYFDGGTVQIQNFLPMSANFTTRFTLDGGLVRLHHIDLITDGARSSITGQVNFSQWPEQTYNVDSWLSFSRMRQLFFADASWRVHGDGRFTGVFHIPRRGHRELRGQFTSDVATLDTPGTRLAFPRLTGSLVWLPDRFAVTDASADLYGGRARFAYELAPLGTPRPATARFDTEYEAVDLQTLARGLRWQSLDLRGRAGGRNEMTWRNGRLKATMTGAGRMTVEPPAGTTLARATVDPSERPAPPEPGPFEKDRPLGVLPIGGEVAYRLDPDGLDLDPSWVASRQTFIAFRGRADYGARSNIPFHVTSHDWQESDRILAAILTAAGAPTGAVEVGGYGQFDGVMTKSFGKPRIEGTFAGRTVRSWGVDWGPAAGHIVIENQFVVVTDGTIGPSEDQQILADGRFALGFRKPSESADELKDVHVRVTNWPLEDFRVAFNLTDWPVAGTVGSADIRLSGPYRGPLGSGTMRIDRGSAWDETFDRVSGNLTFNGVGLEASRVVMAKGAGQATGSALLKWDGTYAFDVTGDNVPVESLTSFTVPAAPLSGVLHFTASGEGEFDAPRYGFKWSVPDLFAGSQGIGAVSGAIEVRNKTLFIPQLEVHSVQVQLSGSGSIALNEAYDSTLNFRFTNSRIDPYLPLVAPKLAERLSQYTRAVVSGIVQVQGELKNTPALRVDATVEEADLTLFDYKLNNEGPVRLSFENDVATIRSLKLVGSDTSLTIDGEIPRSEAPMRLTANGTANLAILQLVLPNVASSGAATLNASVGGSAAALTVKGEATITGGRLRHRGFPHGLEQINGPMTFDANRITVDNVRARMAEGEVTFSGVIDLKGLVPDQFNLRAEGRSMGLRFPTGFRSTVNASLTLTGPVGSPTLGGEVTVLRSIYLQELDTEQAIAALAALAAPTAAEGGTAPESTVPVRLNIAIRAPTSSVRIETALAQVYGSARLDVRGTLDAPAITGLINVERGSAFFNGNRFAFQPSLIELYNQTKIEPYFDVALATRIRALTQTYEISIRLSGQADKLDMSLNADPYLPEYDIVNLLLGERYQFRDVELRSASPQLAQQQAVRTLAAQLLTMPISSRIGSVVQRTIPFDTFSLVPVLGNEAALQALAPGARLTLGKRISERVFLTYSRGLGLSAARQYDIILLEYEQSDRVSWVLSRNEDRTFALDLRIRHVF